MMNLREWALVAFTLLMQTSVGVLLVAGVLQALASRTLVHGPTRAFDAPLLLAAVAGLFALAASFLHLGHPLQAWLALTNVRTSWLSREVLLGSLFVACAAFCSLLTRSGAGWPAVRAVSWMVAAICGVFVVTAMARLYMVPAQPVWNRVVTPVGFVATTLLLGVVVVLLVAPPAERSASALGRALPLLAIALLVVQVVLLPLHLSAFVAEPAAAISAGTAGHAASWLAFARALASIAAIVLLAIWGRTLPALPAANSLVVLFLVFGAEVCGRLLFYAASVHLGPV